MLEYIDNLERYGFALGEPYIKHIEDDIWELRPMRNRVFFVSWNGDGFLLLHCFVKKTQKTPKSEIEKAKNYLSDYIKRSDNDETR